MSTVESDKPTFLLGDDHNIVRQGVALLIDEVVEGATIFHASTLEQIVERVKSTPIDIAILDAQYNTGNCISILGQLKKLQPKMRIMMFTSFEEELYSLKFINEGANGYLNKQSDEEQIKEAIESMIERGEYYPPFTRKLLDMSIGNPQLINPLYQLSERELQIAQLYAKGHGNLEIANELDVKQNTVSTYKKRIFEKLNIDTLVELIEIMKTYHDF